MSATRPDFTGEWKTGLDDLNDRRAKAIYDYIAANSLDPADPSSVVKGSVSDEAQAIDREIVDFVAAFDAAQQ